MNRFFTFKFFALLFSISSFFFHSSAFANDFIQFSNLFAFGDSLTDTGNVSEAPATNRNADGSASIWINDLGNDLGINVTPSSKGGNNYAEYGSVTGTLPFGVVGSHPITEQLQIQQYLTSTGGTANPNALYTVWSGGNDLVDGLFKGLSEDDMLILSQASIGNTLGNVMTLSNAGAKYIIVANIPDFSRTPLAQFLFGNDPQKLEKISELVQGYDTQLLASLDATGKDIIQVDSAGAFAAIQDNFAKFGFVGAESETCNFLSMVKCGSPDPNQDIFFSDGFHPSQATHKIMADYVLSILEGPALTGLLSQTPVSTVQTQDDNIESNIKNLEYTRKKSMVVGQWQFFSMGNYDTSHQSLVENTRNFNPAYHQRDLSFTAGFEELFNPDWIFGFAVGHSMGTVDSNSDTENFNYDQDINMVNFFSGTSFWQDRAYINSLLGYGHIIDNHINRNFRLGICPETLYANTTGDDFSAELNSGYYFKFKNYPALQTGPFIALEYQHVDIDAYAEASSNFETNNNAFDALQYQLQDDNFLNSELGWQWKNTLASSFDDIVLTPSLQISYLHRFMANPSVEAGVTSLPGSHYSVPSMTPAKDFAMASAEIDSTFKQGFTLGLSYNLMGAKHFLSQGVMVNLSIPLSKIKN